MEWRKKVGLGATKQKVKEDLRKHEPMRECDAEEVKRQSEAAKQMVKESGV